MTRSAMTPERLRPVPRSDFPTYRTIPTRWMDVDIYGHVNNVEYLSYFDTAVNGWYGEQGLLDPRTSPTVFLVVETGCHYFSELVFPSTVHAGIRVDKLGTSSVTYGIGLFAGEAPDCAAMGKFVHVHVDRRTRRPTPIPDNVRVRLADLKAHDT
ncbi:thioesterase [Roseibium aquae]|uniref:Thioesterase n=1 Tax=Roseibium aquae TaxID=1323746 RepID=A0A916TMQ5_9HYPH|nr:thioesterase family protein [Roseibium aquae]GGB56365.1 thioesterase [Roseibium aquae]